MQTARDRDYYFDNAKFFLMLLVVLAHAMELCPPGFSVVLYKLIYLFHMPAFVFIAGHFAARQRRLKVGNLVLQYLLFQTIYLVADGLLFGRDIDLQYTRPYWILWFSFAVVLWKVVIPYAAKLPAGVGVVAAVALAALAGYIDQVGYEFSLSRILVFFPYFLLGYQLDAPALRAVRGIPPWAALLAFGASLVALWQLVDLPAGLLYRSVDYESLGLAGPLAAGVRLGVMAWAGLLVCCFLALVPAGQTRYSAMGARTLQAFYLHGLALRAVHAALPAAWFQTLGSRLVLYGCVLAGTLLLLTRPVQRLCRPLMQPKDCLAALWQRAAARARG